jgi:hypothetical protein
LKEDAIKYKGTAQGDAAEKKLAYNKQMLTWAGTIGPEMKKNMALTLGEATNTDGYQKMQRSYSKVSEHIANGGTDFAESMKLITTDAKETSKQFGGLTRSGDFNKHMSSFQEMLIVRSQQEKDFVKIMKDANDQTEDQKSGKDKITDNSVTIAQNQRDKAQSIAQVYHKTMGVTTSVLKQFSIVTRNAWGVLGKLAGKKGQMGGAESGGGLMGILSTAATGAAAGAAIGAVGGLGIGAVPGAIAGGIAGLGAGILGAFSGGGYTGDGGKYDAAGIVHRGEYVIDSTTTKALGLNQSIGSSTKNIDSGVGLSGSTQKSPALGSSRIVNTPEDFSDSPRTPAPTTPAIDPKNDPALIGIDIQKLTDRINQIQRMIQYKPSASPAANFERARMRQDSLRDLSQNAIYEQTGETSVAKLTESLAAYQKLMDQVAKQAIGLQKVNNKPTAPTNTSPPPVSSVSPVKLPTLMDIAFPIPAIVESLSKKITGLMGLGNKTTAPTNTSPPPVSSFGESRLVNTPEDFSDSPRTVAPVTSVLPTSKANPVENTKSSASPVKPPNFINNEIIFPLTSSLESSGSATNKFQKKISKKVAPWFVFGPA